MGADAAAAEVRAALEHAGARFMAMFDDAVEGAERASSRASPSAPRPRGAAPTSAREDRRGATSPARAARKRAREADGASAASPLRARAVPPPPPPRTRTRTRTRTRPPRRPPNPGGGAGGRVRRRPPERRRVARRRRLSRRLLLSRRRGRPGRPREAPVHVRAHLAGARRPRAAARAADDASGTVRSRRSRLTAERDRPRPDRRVSERHARQGGRARRERVGQVVPQSVGCSQTPVVGRQAREGAANAGQRGRRRVARERGAGGGAADGGVRGGRAADEEAAGGRLRGRRRSGKRGRRRGQGPGVGVGPGELQGRRAHAEQARRRVQAGQAGGDERRVPRGNETQRRGRGRGPEGRQGEGRRQGGRPQGGKKKHGGKGGKRR